MTKSKTAKTPPPAAPALVAEPAPPTDGGAVDEMPLAVLRANVAEAKGYVGKMRALVPGLFLLPDDERRHSDGRLRDGEEAALHSVLDVADAHPESFQVLAAKDGGRDPKVFETQLLRERLERRALLAELAAELEPFALELADTLLVLGSLARQPTLAAYGIAKPLAEHDAEARSKLAKALSFYGGLAERAAKSRAAKKTK